MSHQQFSVSERNPNETTGGGGCICDRRKLTDCQGPFIVFSGNRMQDAQSPYPVLCYSCARKAVDRMETEQPLRVGGPEGYRTPADFDRVTGQPIVKPPVEVKPRLRKPGPTSPKAKAEGVEV